MARIPDAWRSAKFQGYAGLPLLYLLIVRKSSPGDRSRVLTFQMEQNGEQTTSPQPLKWPFPTGDVWVGSLRQEDRSPCRRSSLPFIFQFSLPKVSMVTQILFSHPPPPPLQAEQSTRRWLFFEEQRTPPPLLLQNKCRVGGGRSGFAHLRCQLFFPVDSKLGEGREGGGGVVSG